MNTNLAIHNHVYIFNLEGFEIAEFKYVKYVCLNVIFQSDSIYMIIVLLIKFYYLIPQKYLHWISKLDTEF